MVFLVLITYIFTGAKISCRLSRRCPNHYAFGDLPNKEFRLPDYGYIMDTGELYAYVLLACELSPTCLLFCVLFQLNKTNGCLGIFIGGDQSAYASSCRWCLRFLNEFSLALDTCAVIEYKLGGVTSS